MAVMNNRAFRYVLQDSLRLEDSEWSYHIPNLPRPSTTNAQQLIKSISVVSNSVRQQIELRLQAISLNRAISSEPLDRFIIISFSDFRLRVPLDASSGTDTLAATARESADYIVKLLRSGVTINGVHYNFYGHSNSQLKSRTCFLFAAPKPDISYKVEGLGEFSKMKTVAKKAKRIGLLFSVAKIATVLEPNRCQDIPDIETSDYVFTDGCGLISPQFARELARKVRITFRNTRYTPSVLQIRYRGYKGVLMIDTAMKGETLVKFRKSMKKFSGGDDHSFSVVDYSKPYGFGYLNDEVVLLLHALGIHESVLMHKQAEHFKFLDDATHDPRTAFRFLTYINNPELAERVLMDSIETIQPSIKRLVNAEYDRMLNKRDEQRCRILIPKSRLLFGVCDPWGVLKEGECAVKVTMDGNGLPQALHGMEILVTRNPCLHPGDLQKFKVVAKDELAHLVDCIVFPTHGKRPAADLMSGGDLDGDTFFVCWDSDLIPEKVSEPAQYPGVKEATNFKPITDDDRLVYFARYTSTSLGRVKNLYLDWARLKGPTSAECQQLNRLFSQCVDGNNIRIPAQFESPPQPPSNAPPFILDALHEAGKKLIHNRQSTTVSYDGYTFDAMELLLSRENVAMSEFELIKLTYRWCLKNNGALMDFISLFDINILTAEEKIWTLNQLPHYAETPSLVFNALCQSNLLQESQLRPFKLNYPGLKWKRVFDSTRDRLATFLDNVSRSLELFHRKLVVLSVDERLTVAIYVPQKIERGKESQVDDKIRLFAFPHTSAEKTTHRLAVPTKRNYRLYCDGSAFQLYENSRSNTWVYLVRSASDDSSYRNQESTSKRRKGRQATIDSRMNFDCRASIALDKFSRGLQQNVGRINRNGILGAEIYVISNRDIKSMQNLDLWLDFVDTKEIIPLFERNAKEYIIPKLSDVDWSKETEQVVQIAKEGRLDTLMTMNTLEECHHVLRWLLDRGEKLLLSRCFEYALVQLAASESVSTCSVMMAKSMLDFLGEAPFLAVFFGKTDWATLPLGIAEMLENSGRAILQAHILAANEMQEFIVDPFKRAMSQISSMSFSDFAGLVELISLTIRSADLALDLFLECVEPESTRILPGDPTLRRHFVRNLLGIALDHIDEAAQPQPPRKDLLDLKLCTYKSEGFPVVEGRIRIDAPVGTLATTDHVRLTAASSPVNTVSMRRYSIDALVESSQPGIATFRCFHPVPQFLTLCSWELQSCGSFVTTRTMFDAVHTLVTDPGCCQIKEEILGLQRDASINYTWQLAGLGDIDNLNTSQNTAVQTALSSRLTCLWGPPGTGKTHTIVEIINQLQASRGTRRILVTAPTHNAVDNVMRKYLADRTAEGRIGDELIALRVSTDVRKVADDLKKYTCDAMVGKEIYSSYSALNKARDQIKKCRLIFTTCIGAGLGLLRSEKFDTVIIDEASQQTEPASLVPLVKGCEKAILVGDHVQLGATVQRHAVLQQFDISLFERLYQQEQTPDSLAIEPSAHSPCLIAKVMLDTQYRMHESICQFSSDEFYESKLRTGIPNSCRLLPKSMFPWPLSANSRRMAFLECSTAEDLGQKSKSNEGQARICYEVCKMLSTEAEIPPGSPKFAAKNTTEQPAIAVLTPYSRQVELLKSRLSQFANVEVSSIDGFQGREADIVVFVTVRCNAHCEIGFLKDLRRMNVALTRARAAVIVIGNRATLTMGSADPESTAVWKRLLDTLVEVKIAS